MLRGLIVMSLVGGAFAAGLYFRGQDGAPRTSPSLLDQVKKAAVLVPQQSCEDDCEQTAIVMHAPDEQMKACKARCGGTPLAAPVHDVPRSISVAPADHRGGLLPPPDRRIRRTR